MTRRRLIQASGATGSGLAAGCTGNPLQPAKHSAGSGSGSTGSALAGTDYVVFRKDDTAHGIETTTGRIVSQGTDHATVLNETLAASGDYDTVHLRGHFEIDPRGQPANRVAVPSRTTVIVDGVLRRADGVTASASGDSRPSENNTVLGNANPEEGNEDITVIQRSGYFHGNWKGQNIEEQNGPWHVHTLWFKNVRGLRLHGVTVERTYHWACRLDYCTDSVITDFETWSYDEEWEHRDGLHLTDCENVLVDGLFGRSGDDFLAIGVREGVSRNIAVRNVVGESIRANGVKILQVVNFSDRGKEGVIENVDIQGLHLRQTAVNGVTFGPTGKTTTIRDVSIQGRIENAGQSDWYTHEERSNRHGVHLGMTGAGTFEQIDLDVRVENSYGYSVRCPEEVTLRDSRIRGRFRNPGDVFAGRANLLIENAQRCSFDVDATLDASQYENPRPNVVVSGTGNRITGTVRGGPTGIALGGGAPTHANQVSDTHVRGTSGPAVMERDGGDYNAIRNNVFLGTGGVSATGSNTVVAQNLQAPGNLARKTSQSLAPVAVPRQSLSVDGSLNDVRSDDAIDLSAEGDIEEMPADAIGGDLWFAWDEQRFYLAAAIDDATHAQPGSGPSTWKGDSCQFGLAADGSAGFPEFTVAKTDDGTEVFRRTHPDGQSGPVDAVDAVVARPDGETTVYEVGVPWDLLPVVPGDDGIRASVLFNDNDGSGRQGWIEWGGGIGGIKDPERFRPIRLEGA